MSKIIDFYVSGGLDSNDRTLEEILSFSDGEFEKCHDFIQWVFPLHELSLHNMNAPILTASDIEFLQESKVAVKNIKLSLARFKEFLGIDGDETKFSKWAKTGNHNLLRITRVIRSLRLFGLEEEAKDFYEKSLKVAKSFMISPTTMEFWSKALNDDMFTSLNNRILDLKRIG